jgi:NAD+ synthase (glutamine-hydrolysing)
MIAAGPRFGFDTMYLTAAAVDVDATRMSQARLGSRRPNVGEDPLCVAVSFRYPDLDPEASVAGWKTNGAEDSPESRLERPAWEESEELAYEEFARAIAIGLFDYMRKSRTCGFVVSLSGGADSSATCCLVYVMVRLALAELGLAGFRQRFPYWSVLGQHDGQRGAPSPGSRTSDPPVRPATADTPSEADLMRSILTCAYQSTRNSTDTTRNAARSLAEALGATFYELDVDSMAGAYRTLIEHAIGRELTWERDDVTLQNVQARVRAPGIWMLANLQGALLLATSNRSEAAVGYATMDGDTCGGLSPIAGIDKAFLRRWLRWMEREGVGGVGPLPVLAAVNALAPTAELRPAAAAQTDEADLMPYDLLDAIEDAAIGEKKTPVEVFRIMRARFGGYEARQLAAWVERFYRLWCRNQWKRERYAPSFHVDDKNLDPKTWCRFPILSGGFERELEELRRLIG